MYLRVCDGDGEVARLEGVVGPGDTELARVERIRSKRERVSRLTATLSVVLLATVKRVCVCDS